MLWNGEFKIFGRVKFVLHGYLLGYFSGNGCTRILDENDAYQSHQNDPRVTSILVRTVRDWLPLN